MFAEIGDVCEYVRYLSAQRQPALVAVSRNLCRAECRRRTAESRPNVDYSLELVRDTHESMCSDSATQSESAESDMDSESKEESEDSDNDAESESNWTMLE